MECTNYDLIPVDMRDRVIALFSRNDRIGAIKEIRAITGCGLKEAKDAAEALYDNRHNLSSEPEIITQIRQDPYTTFSNDLKFLEALLNDNKTRAQIIDFGNENYSDARALIGRVLGNGFGFEPSEIRTLITAYDRANGRKDPEKLRRLSELKREIEALQAELED